MNDSWPGTGPQVRAAVRTFADDSTEVMGIFSRSGSSYVIGKAANTENENWDF